MRRTASVLLVAAAAALGACGDDDDDSAAEPAGQQTATEGATKAGAEKVPLEGSITEGASEQTEVAPGTRDACVREWAPRFPAGPAREAVLAQCRELPR